MTDHRRSDATPRRTANLIPLRTHAAGLLMLAGPVAVAQLAQVAMTITDTVMLGSLGTAQLAAGGLASNIFATANIMLQGMLTAVSILVAQARGARLEQHIPSIYRTGVLLALLLALPGFILLSLVGPIFSWFGEAGPLVDNVARYADVLRWGMPASMLGIGLMRAFLPALGHARGLLWISLGAAVVNLGLNYGLIHGRWGLPALGLIGPAVATVATLWGSAALLFIGLHGRAALRQHLRGGMIEWSVLCELSALGWPISITYGVEASLFLATSVLMGLLGAAPLAAHQIALNVASLTFMVTLALSQAANVRVGYWQGARRWHEARRAGFVALALAVGFMLICGATLLAAPQQIVGFYLDVHDPANAITVATSISLLGVAAVFQIADGAQVVAAGALRGLKDTRMPMLIAMGGYWGIGLSTGYVLAFHFGLGANGLWWGLAAGLAAVACSLSLRFHWSSRPMLLHRAGRREARHSKV